MVKQADSGKEKRLISKIPLTAIKKDEDFGKGNSLTETEVYKMGTYYARGENYFKKDLTKALKWYQRAADLGNIDAKNRLEELSRK